MLLATKETKEHYIELHTSELTAKSYIIELYEKTPHGKVCTYWQYINKTIFDILTDESIPLEQIKYTKELTK